MFDRWKEARQFYLEVLKDFQTTTPTKRKEKNNTKQEISSHTQIMKADLSALSSSEEI